MRNTMMNGVVALVAAAGMALVAHGQTQTQTQTQTKNQTKTQQTNQNTTSTPTIKQGESPKIYVQQNTVNGQPTITRSTTPFKNNNTTKTTKVTKTAKANTTGTTTNTGNTTTGTQQTLTSAGREHLELQRLLIGEWNTTTTAFNGSNTSTTSGKARFFPGMAGRFVCSDFTTDTNTNSPAGFGFFGYNNQTKQYENTWVGAQNNGITFWTGTRTDPNTFTWTGNFTNPTTGQTTNGKAVTTFTGNGTMTYTLYGVDTAGKEFKSLEVNYSRISLGLPLELRPVETTLTKTNTTRTTGVNTTGTITDK